ncbi:MAG: RNA methyltransferase [Bacteroidota bacterium]|nr:RNA methyltransferase [Bacteroidota bacterium]
MTNNELKYFEKLKQKKYRDLENKFLIEGVHLIEECLDSKMYSNELEKIFIREDFVNEDLITGIKDRKAAIELIPLDEKIFNNLSETVNSQGIIGVVNKSVRKLQNDNLKSNQILLVALDNINDPGNLGTILRTCYWFGVHEVAISDNSADIYNSKVIRSSQGAIFNLIIQEKLNLEYELDKYFNNNFAVYLSDANANNTLSNLVVNVEKKIVLVFGNEANGISKEILANKNYSGIRVKGFSNCESLNVAVTAGIVLYEFKMLQI